MTLRNLNSSAAQYPSKIKIKKHYSIINCCIKKPIPSEKTPSPIKYHPIDLLLKKHLKMHFLCIKKTLYPHKKHSPIYTIKKVLSY